MSLAVSCDSLFFPAEPFDNIISLKWNANDAPLEPNTSVIFKVKCTAPQLFHVVPRYGALLLADAMGSSVQTSSKAAEIIFGLREHHAGQDEDGNAAAAPSAVNRASTARVSRASSAAPGGPAYQERFAIEYVMIKSEPLAFQQIFSTLADHAKLTEVVKSMWSLVASGAIPRAHLGVQSSINMKVFMENVVLNRHDPLPSGAEDAVKVIVPMEARLISPNAHERQSKTNGRNPSTAASRRTSENGSAAGSATTPSRRKAVDELRALKEEINSMRRDSSASNSGLPQNMTSPNAAGSPSAPRAGDVSVSLAAKLAAGAASPMPSAVLQKSVNEDIIMKLDVDTDADGKGLKKSKKGLKVSLVLGIMFVLYILVLLMRGRSGDGIAASVAEVVKPTANDTANAYAVQISSRELEKVKTAKSN